MAKIDQLFQLMVKNGSSDLHLSAGAPPILRLHGEMVPVPDYPVLDNNGVQELIFEILNEKQKKSFVENWELDCSYNIEGLSRFRCNVFMQRRGMGGVFRVIPTEIKTASQLGLPHQVIDLVDCARGLILVTGPTGSGKSTTLAAMLHTINMDRQEHILTIEDPIEFVHENRKSLVNQREVTSHTKSFKNALKAALREDPDVILVGEMRDLETIELAMTAAETGHLVFGTLHTNSAASTVDRIIDVFPPDRQAQVRVMLSESLRGVVAQNLFKRIDKPGRVAAIEVLVNIKAVANLIREGKTFQIPSSMQTGAEQGMLTFETTLSGLVEDGKISLDDAEGFVGKKLKINKIKKPSEESVEKTSANFNVSANPANVHIPKMGNMAAPVSASAVPKPRPPAPAAGAVPQPPKKSGIVINETISPEDEKKGLFKGFGFGKKSG